MMEIKDNNLRLISKVLAVGALIAVLSYLFHPEVGQFSLAINGQPVAEPIIRFAALPTFLVIMVFTVFLTMLLFFGIGLLAFLGALVFAFTLCLVIAPYFWPMLAIIFFLTAIMSLRH